MGAFKKCLLEKLEAPPTSSERSIDPLVRQAVIQRCKGRCECCGEQLPLTMHHLHYETVGQETPEDLEGLCWTCHKAKHIDPAGAYWRDPQEMYHYWYTYCEELERG